MNDVQVAVAPINWSNDDLPELGAEISFEQCIEEMRQAGYAGCEVGHKFSRQTEQLKKALAPKGLRVASAWFSTHFTVPGQTQESVEGFMTHMHFLKAMGAKVIVVAECGHSIQQQSKPILEDSPQFNESQWQALSEGLETIGRLANGHDMSIVYHPHMGTGVEGAQAIDRLMAETSAALVSLLLDTGHLYFAGADSVEVIQQHGHRIKHVHLKDIRQPILDKVKQHRLSFLQGVKEGVFTVPGDGCIDFKPIFAALADISYQGWWVVEAEQDPSKAHPLTYAKKARQYVRELAGI